MQWNGRAYNKMIVSITLNGVPVMSEKQSCCCQKPEMLKTEPEQCSPETIKACHGQEPSHPCVPEEKDKPATSDQND